MQHLEHCVVRALKFRGTAQSSAAFRAITGLNPHSFATQAKVYSSQRYCFCFHCGEGAVLFSAICSRPACVIQFNQLSDFRRYDWIKYRFPDALWLTTLDFTRKAYNL